MLPVQRDEYVGLLLDMARRRIKQAVLRRVAGLRLAPRQFWVLVALRERPGIAQSELAERARIDAPTASRVLAALAHRRLVRVDADPGDRRRTVLSLTAAGERLARDLAIVAREVRAAVVDGMGEGEVETLRRGLLRVIDNMDRFESRSPARRTS